MVAFWFSPATGVSSAGGPTTPVAVKRMVTPGTAALVAVRVLIPTADPRVHLVGAALPSVPVTVVPPCTVPPPDTTAKTTGAPAIGLPAASRTSTVGGFDTSAPATAVCRSPRARVRVAAAPAESCSTGAAALASPLDSNRRFTAPTGPEMERFVKVAFPWASVRTSVVPPSETPSGATSAVTSRPRSATGFPEASWTCTTGCCASGAPLAAATDGVTTKASRTPTGSTGAEEEVHADDRPGRAGG